jgi:hypothetical protein
MGLIAGSNKESNWIEGVIRLYDPKHETIVIGENPGKTISLKDLPKEQKDKIQVGKWVTFFFKKGETYFARTASVLHTRIALPEVKMTVEDLLKEEPFYGEEIHAKLNDDEKERILRTYNHNTEVAARIFAVSATYEESKQDMDKIIATIREIAAQLTVIADNSSHQILKSKMPKEKT